MERPGRVSEVFFAFLRLGVTSFGGPIAHLGYFRDDLVVRRKWMDDRAYADLVALCQFLPGPASSQVGFAMGLQRAGFFGALAAFVAFTLPSAILLVAFAGGAALLGGPVAAGVISGLQITAVAIVAQAVWGMARTLAPDAPRASIAVAGLALALLVPGAPGQLGALAVGLLGGIVLLRGASETPAPSLPSFGVPRVVAVTCLVLLAIGLVGLPLLAATTGSDAAALVDAFFRSGALVFGGGHVVLPLLQAGVVETGWVSPQAFLAGYGAAQAVPGPLFAFSAYLGAESSVGPGGIAGAAIALVAIFLPGFLVLVGVLPFWDAMRDRPRVRAAMRGTGAAVVGILGAALYTPVFTTAVTGPGSFLLAAVGFVLLTAFRVPAWAVVIVGAAGGVGLVFT
ncbi:chromate transporter [Microbacterium testaceum]|uniref:chromate efflux transporter n=1 Tax=Microbacterium TaxID=33882 RepID=UPI002781260D|nr:MULTISPECIES: chromate efflux transporter [Microbacterium]MDQ1112570.1 chromate transporter [Microbacterium testaceum]MDR6096893.1 chromate transporter [Microbacterium sp. SORGH_AS_0454]